MNFLNLTDEEFDAYYVIKIHTQKGEKYFFTNRMNVGDIGLAKKFNTMRSAKRSVKIYSIKNYEIEKLKRNF